MKVYDSAFLIGKSHHELATPCQDYALCFDTSLGPVAVVADGCSQAGQTDLGARAWALAAKHVIQRTPLLVKNAEDLRNALIDRACEVLNDLPYMDGFSTLLICANFEDTTYIHVFGDGVVMVQKKDQSYESRVYNYSPNAPFYLNYLRKDAELAAWQSSLKEGLFTEDICEHTSSFEILTKTTIERPISTHKGHFLEFSSADLVKVMVATDGACSFQDQAFNHNPQDTLREIGQFKSTVGEFVHRRMAALSRKISKNQFSAHFDDLAVACICTVEELQNV